MPLKAIIYLAMKVLLVIALWIDNYTPGVSGIEVLRNEINSREKTDIGIKLNIDPPLKTQVGFLLSGFLVGSSVVLAGSERARKYAWFGWEYITSPNHAGIENRGKFHIKSFKEELEQSDQLDKGVHFTTSYILSRVVALPCAYLIYSIEGSKKEMIPEGAYNLASFFVITGSLFEELIDGHEKDEGFSYTDVTMDLLGILSSYLKRKGKLDFVDFYWTFTKPPSCWKYHWWNCMGCYSFNVRVSLYPKHLSRFLRWWSQNVAYLPDRDLFTKLSLDQRFPISR